MDILVGCAGTVVLPDDQIAVSHRIIRHGWLRAVLRGVFVNGKGFSD